MSQSDASSHERSEHNSPDCWQSKPMCTRLAAHAIAEVSISPGNVGKTEASQLLPGERWFAIQSQPHREPLAANQLRNQGFHVFLPLLSKTWRHARRMQTRLVSFFPGYLFIVLDLDRDRWRSVNCTFGVQQLVMIGGESRPTPLPPGVIEAIISKVDERSCLHPNGLLRVGQQVQIVDGPFGDRMGELISLDGAGRVRVLIELFGGRISTTLSCNQVTPAR